MTARSTRTKITLAHGMTLDGKYRNAGDEITVENDEIGGLTAAGYVDAGSTATLVDTAAEADTA